MGSQMQSVRKTDAPTPAVGSHTPTLWGCAMVAQGRQSGRPALRETRTGQREPHGGERDKGPSHSWGGPAQGSGASPVPSLHS